MVTIFQVSACVILVVGLFALGHKFFPNFKNWLDRGKISYVWLFAITVGLFLFLTYPFFFNWWALNFWGVPEGELSDYTKLGPLGDIYGSLNTLISSIALCAVAYSTWIQTTSLRETRISNEKQLSESKHAIFSDMFYNLLMHSKDTVNALTIKGKNKTEILNDASNTFSELLKNEWKHNLENLTHENVRVSLRNFVNKISDCQRSTGFYSSFYNYKTLISFVKKEKEGQEQDFYLKIISNSMSYTEKKILLWLAVNSRNNEYLECFKNTYILDLKLEPLARETEDEKEERELMLLFIKHFQIDPTSFKYHPDIHFSNQQTPT